MSKEVLKTDYYTLQNCLIEIAEIPARLNRCDIVLKNELIEHINIRIQSLLKTINERLLMDQNYNYPIEYLPNKKFEYWAQNIYCVFNYYDLINLREFIKNSIEVKKQKSEFEHLFNENGLELFDYLNDKFEYKAITVKYTILLLFLRNTKFYKSTDVNYQKFIIQYCELEKTKIKFSRLANIDLFSKEYTENEQNLTTYLKEFKNLKTIE